MIPNKEQWEEAWSGLDESYAFEHFHGKTLAEAEDMLHENAEYYCEDFLWMPRGPFLFYFQAYKSYLLSPRSEDNDYAAHSFLGLIKLSLEYHFDWIKEDWDSILAVLERLADQQAFYDSMTKAGKFRKKVDQLRDQYAENKG